MGSPSSARRRYPSPLIKQDLAKLGKDADSRRSALASLRSVVEEHLDTTSLPRFLQQIEDSREGRRHVAPVLEDLARTHGPSLAPHIPRLLHLLVHNLLASAGSPALLGACAEAVAGIARHCAGNTAEEVLRQVCLPLLALLPNKIPPLSTGAAVCLRSLVDSEQWRFAPPSLVDDLCWKAAMAAAAPPTQTVPHIHLLRALATSNASAISKFAPPLLRLSLDILLTPAATASWQLRLSTKRLITDHLRKQTFYSLPTVQGGYDFIMVIVHMLTKVSHLIPVKKTYTASDISRLFVKEIFRLHGLPKRIISDRDAKFTSKFWKALFEALRTQLCFSSAYHPQSDGQTKRVNQVIEDILRAYCSKEPKKWIQFLPLVEFSYSSSFHTSIGMSPFKALYGHECVSPLNFSDPTIRVEATKKMLEEMGEQTKAIRQDIQAAKDRQKHYAD
ncbi:hypothetical protein L7F22_029948 [Adiantum nelumboides]|nr:hypothetical protein [Adiantum nelumboides]